MAKREVFEIFGLIGVIGSLIFVGVEVRQNTAEIRGSTHQSVSEQVNELYLTKLIYKKRFIFFILMKLEFC